MVTCPPNGNETTFLLLIGTKGRDTLIFVSSVALVVVVDVMWKPLRRVGEGRSVAGAAVTVGAAVEGTLATLVAPFFSSLKAV